jgi:osmotically-inducible protein OsmY
MLKTLLVAAVTATAAISTTGCAQLGRLVEAPVDDAAVATRVRAALAADPEVGALKITADSSQATVRLKGEVKNMATRRKVEEVVRKVQGVKGVDNQLVITG